ncbi:uncharacterized protein LOC143569125 [Bidens hawaiensis]|uniref:uncharacterized protein LOC143569125 n=1 Tax=Bidens hawaiensis TaxID=980011 RepID=UPI00404B57AC
MAKVMWVEDERLDNGHPRCMSGLFCSLKHAKCNKKYKRVLDDQDHFEVLKLFDAKTSHILVDHSNRKRSLKARIKALISEHQDFVSSPKLQRTYSIHHLETNEWVHPIIFFPENVTERTVSSNCSKTRVKVTNPEVNDSRDILEMFEVDKELFINMLQERSVSSNTKQKSMPMKLKDKLNESYIISKNSNDDVNGKNIMSLRRISSHNESATRFIDFSVSKATLRASRSLKLTNRSENQGSRDTYLFRSSSQNERNHVSLSVHKDKYAELNSTQDCESLNEVKDKSDTFLENEQSFKAKSTAFCEDAHELKVKENSYQISREITQERPVLVSEYCPQDKKVQISNGVHKNVEKEIKTVNNKKQMESSTKDDDFAYVKKILERSGFIKIGFQQTWYSSNQPLDPFVFQEMESHYFHDPERFAEEVNELSHRLLVFDLVDDVLLTTYERAFTYYPRKLSSNCHISPTPTGSLVLDQVWNNVSRMLNFKHDINESLNDIVSRDLRSGDGWMNLQLVFESVGLDLEDLILDEVLDEIVFELL